MIRANPPPEIQIDPVRNRLGKALAALCAVRRSCDYFTVTPPSFSESPPSYKVWRDNQGCVRCSCADYAASNNTQFRCEHILAVKHFLLAKPIAAHRAPDGSARLLQGLSAGRAGEYAGRLRIIRVLLLHAAVSATTILGEEPSHITTLSTGMPEALLSILEECGDEEAARMAAQAFLEKRESAREAA